MTAVINQHIDETNGWALYHGDSVEVIKGIPDSSVGYSVYSPPFASLYTYSNSERDLGNCSSHAQFYEHYRYLLAEILRVLKPGRCMSVHCMPLPLSKAIHGHIGLADFRGIIVRACEEIGFIYHSEVCIWKDPVTMMQRTKALGLLHKQLVKDSAMSRQALPDYLVTLRKPGLNPEPISGPLIERGDEIGNYGNVRSCPVCEARSDAEFRFCPYCATQLVSDPIHAGDISSDERRRTIEIWQRLASPIWTDINQSDTLQFRSARQEADERHICPLQLEVIRRGALLWSNPGDVILSPFAGIGSEGWIACGGTTMRGARLKARKFIGIELKQSYYEQAVANLQALRRSTGPTLADIFGYGAEQ